MCIHQISSYIVLNWLLWPWYIYLANFGTNNTILFSMINEFHQTSMKTTINASIKINSDRSMNVMKMQINVKKGIWLQWFSIYWFLSKSFNTYHISWSNEMYRNYSTKGSGKIGWKQISFLLTFKDEKIWCMTPSNNYAEMTMKISK